jgi:hypothetical protein
MLGWTYADEDYEDAITVVGLHQEESQMEIEYQKKLDEGRNKNNKGK